MDTLLAYQWEIFIALEVIATVSLLLFLVTRYAFTNQKLSLLFLYLFFILLGSEAVLAIVVYKQTGEISTFTIVIAIFILYAATFGISDFRKLDRFIKKWIGKWKNIDLLSDKDKERMERAKDPKVISRNSLIWWLSHVVIFLIVHVFLWMTYGKHDDGIMYFLTDWSWYSAENLGTGPFTNEMVGSISQLWILIIGIDTIVSWSYILFPGKKQSD